MRVSFATVGLVAATSALASPFQMPSGNIRCTSDVHNGQPSDIVCTILERSGHRRRHLHRDATTSGDMHLSWADAVMLRLHAADRLRSTAAPGAGVREDLDVWRRDLRVVEERAGVPKRRWARLLFVTRTTVRLLSRDDGYFAAPAGTPL
jgi:hypothetical protein